jgi:hypothetical protein
MSEQLALDLIPKSEPEAGEYLVLKESDIDAYLSTSEKILFRFMADVVASRRHDAAGSEFRCVVIEHDLPILRPGGIALEAILVEAIKQIPKNYSDALGM